MFITDPHAITSAPNTIVSLVPSLTELLAYFDLDEETKGITKFCVHPQEWFRNKIRIGGTKNVHTDQVTALKPDLVICNKEENIKDQVEALAENVPVYLSDVKTFEDALIAIKDIGILTGKIKEAEALMNRISDNFAAQLFTREKINTVYLIWKKPYMTIGTDTFISDMMDKAGFANSYADKTRYPEVSAEEIKSRNPQLILLSSEPYPFKEKDIQELKEQIPGAKILLTDGEMFSWYGSRMLFAADYFKQLRAQI